MDPTQPTKNWKISTQPNPTHGQLCLSSFAALQIKLLATKQLHKRHARYSCSCNGDCSDADSGPPTDRATRYVSQNLANCRIICTTNPQQIEVMEFEGCRRPARSKQPRLVDCRVGVVKRLDRRRRVLLAIRSTCSGEIFWVQSLGEKFTGTCPYFWSYLNFL